MMNETELQTVVISPAVKAANEIVVSNNNQYTAAGENLTMIKASIKRVKEFFADPKEKAHSAWKALTTKESDMIKPLSDAEHIIKQKMTAFQTAQEQLRIEAQRKADEEAAKLERQAIRAANKGDEEKATELQTRAAMKSAEVNYVTPKAAGVSVREVWKFRITDLNQVPREYLMVNEVMLSRVAGATKGALKIPGVEIYSEKSLAVRS